MRSKPDKQSRVLRLMAGWCALLVFAGTSSPIGWGVAAGLGSLDRSHHLSLQSGETGSQLVLQHGNRCVLHRHGVVARMMTFFAQPASPANPDHVIQFGTADNLSAQPRLNTSKPTTASSTDLAFPEPIQPAATEALLALLATHRPPRQSGEMVACSTILLI